MFALAIVLRQYGKESRYCNDSLSYRLQAKKKCEKQTVANCNGVVEQFVLCEAEAINHQHFYVPDSALSTKMVLNLGLRALVLENNCGGSRLTVRGIKFGPLMPQ